MAANEDVVSISVNFDYPGCDTDYIFVSNLRRFRELDTEQYGKCIVTSNIPADNVYLQTNYFDLLLPIEAVQDNAGLMAIKFFMELGVKEIYLAGFDGYSHDVKQNYALRQMELITKNAVIDAMNEGMIEILRECKKNIRISWLTEQKKVIVGE